MVATSLTKDRGHSHMNKIIDIKLSTQLSTVIAMVLTYLAHIIGNGTILNDNWTFMVYVLIPMAMLFMVLPYLFSSNEDKEVKCIQITNQ
jgi:hypothetical protein